MANTIIPISSGGGAIAPAASKPAASAQIPSASSEAATTAGSDAAKLSAAGELLGAAISSLSSSSPVRFSLVAQLRDRIAAGNYQPPNDQVAAAITKALR